MKGGGPSTEPCEMQWNQSALQEVLLLMCLKTYRFSFS